MNMFSTGNREQDELLRLLREGLITPEQARDVGQDYGSLSIADFANLGAFAPETQRGSGRAAVRDAELEQRANVTPTADAIVRGTTRGGRAIGSKPGLLDVGMTQKQGRVGRGRNEDLVYGSKQNAESRPSSLPAFMQQGRDVDIIGMDEEARTADKVRGLPTLRRDIADPNMADDTITASYDQGEIDLEGMAPSQQTLLQRIGNALKDNPELAASGAQLLGGLLSNVAQNRAQRRADRTNRERTGRANLISALTGGRVRPDVERAQADTGGFMSLDTLGKALQGGGAAYKGELARQVEEAERERRAGLDERAAAVAEQQADTREQSRIDEANYRNRVAELQEMGAAFDLFKLMNSGEKMETPPQKVQDQYKAAGQVIGQIDDLVNLMEDAGALAAGSPLSALRWAGLENGLPQFTESGEQTREIVAAANALVQTLGENMSGVLSNQDIVFIKEQSIDPEDTVEVALRKADLIKNRLSRTLSQNYAIDSQFYNMAPFSPLVEGVVSSGDQGAGAFVRDLANANLKLD